MKNKATITHLPTETEDFMLGSYWQHKREADIYILCVVNLRYALVSLTDGNHWSNHEKFSTCLKEAKLDFNRISNTSITITVP